MLQANILILSVVFFNRTIIRTILKNRKIMLSSLSETGVKSAELHAVPGLWMTQPTFLVLSLREQ